MAPVVGDEHRPGGYGSAAVLPIADNGVLMHLHVCVQLFPVVELFDAFLALKGEPVGHEVRQYVALGFVALLADLELILMCVLDVGASGA